ncbi:MAG: hypothetical protein GXO81_08570 [Chlorobi bacterium]|nr:hypothetical protein [Chlorobiota bacterium]
MALNQVNKVAKATILILLIFFVSCNNSNVKQQSAQNDSKQDIAEIFGGLPLDTPPEELYKLFNQFCKTYYGAERDQLIYETFGNKLEVIEESRWDYFSEQSATIAWETNLPANTYVEYGETEEYGLKSEISERPFYIHVHYLKGLKPNTLYHYKFVSIDERGNKAESGDLTFHTKAIKNAIHIPGDLGNPPYLLNKPNSIYLVTEDIIAGRTAFNIEASNITLDLGGHTIIHAHELIPELDYSDLEKSGVGIRRVDYNNNLSGLTILNGIIKQGAAKNNQDYTAAKDMLRPDPDRKAKLEKNSSRGFSNIEITNFNGVEIAGVTLEYHLPQTWGMRFEAAGGEYNIHHNVITDKGTQLFNRHGGGTVRSIGFRSEPGGYSSNNDNNEIQIHHNLIKRTRQNALHTAQKIYNNEIYVDSWVVNSFAISPYKHNGQVYNNKIFLTGYYACGILWATSDLNVSNNLIQMESINTMIEKPMKGRRLIETWGEQDVIAGLRMTNYGKGGQERENLIYSDNLVIGHSRGGAEMRGTEFYSDYSIRGLFYRNGIIKIEVDDTITRKAACVDTQGAFNDRSKHLPLYYENCSLISNICNVRFGDDYGQGSNHQFINCKIIKTGNNPNYHTFVFDGHSSVFNHVFLDCKFIDGASYNDVYWNDTQSLSNYRIVWTLDVATNHGAKITIKDKNGKVTQTAVADADGKYSTPLVQSIIRPVEWAVGGDEVEITDKNNHQEELLSPYTITIEAKGGKKSTTIEMNERKMLTLKI